MSMSDEEIVIYLVISSMVLLYLMRFIEPEIEKMENENKIKINPYLPFCISSPLLSPINQNHRNIYQISLDSQKV